MFIRSELLTPSPSVATPQSYLTLVGLHSTLMIFMASAAIIGPFGNYFVPIMIGSRNMAFPRLEALTFWLLPPAGLILLSTVFLGGFTTGWTGYAPLSDQNVAGMDSYLMAFALIGISIGLSGLNMISTIFTKRAPGMPLSRMPVFVWSVLVTSFLGLLAAPALIGAVLMETIDRSYQTTFFVPAGGGSPYLWENLFWFFGHPEVYIFILPAFGLVMEMLPAFTRKPLWGYRVVDRRDGRSWPPQLHGVATPSVRQWACTIAPPLLHVLDGVDLGSDRDHLSNRAGIDVASTHAFQYTDAFHMRILLQFPDRRLHRGLPLGRAERLHAPRELLCSGTLPLHDHGRGGIRAHGGDCVLPAEDDRVHDGHEAVEIPVLGGVHHLQRYVHLADRRWHTRDDTSSHQLCVIPATSQHFGLRLRLRLGYFDGALPRDTHLASGGTEKACHGQPVGVPRSRMAAADTGSPVQLRHGACRLVSPV